MKRILVTILLLLAAGCLPVRGQGVYQQNQFMAGPLSGSGFPSPRAITGSDLPNPSGSTLGGIESLTCATHQWLNTISVAGVPACAQPSASDISGLGTMATQNAGAVAITGGTITGLPNPTNPSDAATMAYAASVSSGIHPLAASRLATAAVLPNSPTYANGASGVGATLTAGSNSTLTVDGTVANLNDVILVQTQASAFQNGIYTVTTAGSGAAAWVLTRATYFNTAATMLVGSTTAITAGSSNLNKTFALAATVTTVGTTAANFNLFNSGGNVFGPGSSTDGHIATYNGTSGAVIKDGGTVISLLNSLCTLSPSTCAVFFGFYNVVWYGADPTGVSSSVTPINNAISAACDPSIRGTVWFPTGTYLVNGGVNATGITAGCTIGGASINSTILETTSTTATNAILDLTGSSFVTLQNLQLNSSLSTNTKYGILNAGSTTTACNESQFNQISVFGAYQKALVYTYGCTELLWYNSYFTNQPSSSALLAIMIYTTSNIQSAVSSYATIVSGTVAGGGTGHYGIQIHDQNSAVSGGTSTVIPVYISGVQSPLSFNDSIIAGSVGSITGGAIYLNNNAQNLTLKNVNVYADNGTQNAYVIYNTGTMVGLNIEGCSLLYSTGLLGNTSGSTYLSTKILGNSPYPASIPFINTVTGNSSLIRSIVDVQGMTINLGAGGTLTHDVIFTPGTITAGTQTNNGSF